MILQTIAVTYTSHDKDLADLLAFTLVQESGLTTGESPRGASEDAHAPDVKTTPISVVRRSKDAACVLLRSASCRYSGTSHAVMKKRPSGGTATLPRWVFRRSERRGYTNRTARQQETKRQRREAHEGNKNQRRASRKEGAPGGGERNKEKEELGAESQNRLLDAHGQWKAILLILARPGPKSSVQR